MTPRFMESKNLMAIKWFFTTSKMSIYMHLSKAKMSTKSKIIGKRSRGFTLTTSAILICGCVVCYELKRFHQNLKTLHDVTGCEKTYDPFIYLPNQDDIPIKKVSRLWMKLQNLVNFLKGNSVWNTLSPLVLLKCSQSKDPVIRHRAISLMSNQSRWSDADYLMVAQGIDFQTYVTLASTKTTDDRLLRAPPFLPLSKDSTEDELKKLVSCLPKDGTSRCCQYFKDFALKRRISALSSSDKASIWGFEGSDDLSVYNIAKKPVDVVIIIYLLQALLGHSQVSSQNSVIVTKDALLTLRRAFVTYHDELTIVHIIARILCNLTVSKEVHEKIFESGWVSIFSSWLRSSDLLLSFLAAKSLANLDREWEDTRDHNGNYFYDEGIYLFHPHYKEKKSIHADIVFVHGLLGGPLKTWRQQDQAPPTAQTKHDDKKPADDSHDIAVEDSQLDTNSDVKVEPRNDAEMLCNPKGVYTFCWPKDWLAQDCPHVRILTVEYETRLSNWSLACPYDNERRTIEAQGQVLLKKLLNAGIGQRPVIWVGHSMGGLLIKQILCTANEQPALRPLVTQTRGIIYYSVPHNGSSLVDLSRRAAYLLYPSVEVRQLALGSPQLKSLHERFLSLMSERDIPLVSFAEGQCTYLPFNLTAKVVPEDSSDPGFGEFYVMPNCNHVNICKPEHKDAQLYQLTLDFIKNCLTNSEHHSS